MDRETEHYIAELEDNCVTFSEQLLQAREDIAERDSEIATLQANLDRAEERRARADHDMDLAQTKAGELYDEVVEKNKEIRELRETVARLRGGAL